MGTVYLRVHGYVYVFRTRSRTRTRDTRFIRGTKTYTYRKYPCFYGLQFEKYDNFCLNQNNYVDMYHIKYINKINLHPPVLF